MAKKLSEMTVKKIETKTPTPPGKRGESEVLDITNGMSRQLKRYGKRIPYTELEKTYDWVFLNIDDLITLADHYLRTYTNLKRAPAPQGGITQRRNNRITKIKDFLLEFEKKRE